MTRGMQFEMRLFGLSMLSQCFHFIQRGADSQGSIAELASQNANGALLGESGSTTITIVCCYRPGPVPSDYLFNVVTQASQIVVQSETTS